MRHGGSKWRRAGVLVAGTLLPILWLGAGGCSFDISLGPAAEPSGGAGTTTTTSDFDAGTPCQPSADNDWDEDGYAQQDGDCNDCNPYVNPNAAELVTPPGQTPVDEDCDGIVDEQPSCDAALAVGDDNPLSAAAAIELCKASSGPGDWGVVSARWTLPNGDAVPPLVQDIYRLGHGILPSFGAVVTPRHGARMLALSSGTARPPQHPEHFGFQGFDKFYITAPAPGFPKETPACPDVITGEAHDAVALEIEVLTPSNAGGLLFDFDFFTFEWPEFICDEYNDYFLALLFPQLPNTPDANISFDINGNPVSTNSVFLEVCGCAENPPLPCFAGGKWFQCALGNGELMGTGFGRDTGGEDHGSTSWLETEAPVSPNQTITLRLVVHDSTDGLFDSLVLVDNFRWKPEPAELNTKPIPE